MVAPLSIKERIEQLYVAILQAIPGIGTIYRWDARGLRDPATGLGVYASGARAGQKIALQSLDAMLVPDDETADEGGQGDVGMTLKKLPVEVHLKLVQGESDTTGSSSLVNLWLLAMETAVMANPTLVETSGGRQRLAIDTQTTDTGQPPRETGQREITVPIRFLTQYAHYRDDPTRGPGITPYPVIRVTSVTDNGDNTLNVAFDGLVLAAAFTAAHTHLTDVGNDGPVTTWTQVDATTLKGGGSGYLGPFVGGTWSLTNPPPSVLAGQTGTIV